MLCSRKKICKLIALGLAAIMVCSIVFAYTYYLDIKKTFLAKVSSKATSLIGQRIDIRDISFSLLSGINFHDLQIQNPEGFIPGQLLKIKRIALDMNYRELLAGKLHFRHIYVYAPELTVIKNREGMFNISDELRRFLSKKGTLKYEVDELTVSSGMVDFNKDHSLRNERIKLSLKKLSSSPGTRTLIQVETMWAGQNKMRLDGWANLTDERKKFSMSVSAEDFRLAAFRMLLAKYPVDVENTGLKMTLDAAGDTDNGINITTRVQLKSPGGDYYKKKLLAISLDAAVFYDISAGSAKIENMSIKAGDDSSIVVIGQIKDLQRIPVYDLKMKIENLNLSAFKIFRGFETGGILMSDAISIKGRLDNTLPEVSGIAELRNASVKSDTADVRKMNARVIFSSGGDISASGEASAEVLSAGGYPLSMPVKVGISLDARARKREVVLSASVSTSPIYLEAGKKRISLEDGRILIDGTLREKEFSGKSTLKAGKMQYAGYSVKNLMTAFKADYRKNIIELAGLKMGTDNFSSSADLLKLDTSGGKGRFLIEAKNLKAEYPEEEAGLHGLDLSATLNVMNKGLSGDLRFSVADVKSGEFSSGRISGNVKFNNNDFLLEIPQADVSGGRIRLSAQGRTSQGPFPLKAEVAAERIDLGKIALAVEKRLQSGYLISGNMESLSFKGMIDSKESLRGETALDLRKFSVLNRKTKKILLKDASMQTGVTFNGRDCEVKSTASSGALSIIMTGSAKECLGEKRSVHMQGRLKETPVNEIRTTFWDIFPDSLLYAGMDGSVSSDISLDYRQEKVAIAGALRMKDFVLKGENNEYSVGPVNGVVPFAYGAIGETGKAIALPSFERSDFASIGRQYSEEQPGVDYNRITIGSLEYGFRLLEDINVWIKQDGSILNVGRFSANIFGGKMNGSAVIDLSSGLHYRAGMVLQGLSMTKLCDDIEPIRGYISGKVDGIGLLKGSGAGFQELIGRADFWTYSTKGEKTKISREFLQKIGGPSIKSYVGDRSFNKGLMSFYIQNGFLVFRDLEIANRNLLGIQDLSVKVAPLNNRISIDHLMWTLVEAAERAKKNSE